MERPRTEILAMVSKPIAPNKDQASETKHQLLTESEHDFRLHTFLMQYACQTVDGYQARIRSSEGSPCIMHDEPSKALRDANPDGLRPAQSRPYSLRFRHKVAWSMPRTSAAS